MINELTLKNFKSWEKIERMRLAPITGLFGTNSSGKSSILQTLLLLKQTIESSDRSLPLLFGGEKDYVELGMFRDVIWSHDMARALFFKLNWDLPKELEIENPEKPTETLFSGNKMAFSTEIDCSDKGLARVKQLEYFFSNKTFSLTRQESGNQYQLSPTQQGNGFRFIRTRGRNWDIPRPVKFYGFPDQVMTYYQNTVWLPDFQLELENLFSRIYYLGPLRDFPKRRYIWSGGDPIDVGQRGERAIDAILAAKEKEPYIYRGKRKHIWTLDTMLAHQLKELGLIHEFSVNPIAKGSNLYEVRVKKTPGAAEVLITDVGFGVSQVLPILVLCYFVPEGSTILFEQPEIHLHPSVQSGLADVFIDVAKHRNIQLIIESHSEHLLKRLQRRIAEDVINPDDTALYFCETEQKTSILKKLEANMYGNIENWPANFFGDQFGEVAAQQEAALDRQIKSEKSE
jgi:AAA15 family ATPase/GTPase